MKNPLPFNPCAEMRKTLLKQSESPAKTTFNVEGVKITFRPEFRTGTPDFLGVLASFEQNVGGTLYRLNTFFTEPDLYNDGFANYKFDQRLYAFRESLKKKNADYGRTTPLEFLVQALAPIDCNPLLMKGTMIDDIDESDIAFLTETRAWIKAILVHNFALKERGIDIPVETIAAQIIARQKV